MTKRWTCVVMVLVAVATLGCAEKETLEEAWTASQEKYEAATTPAEKVAISKAFLERFPDSEHTVRAAGSAARLLHGELNDPRAADALLVSVLSRVSTEKTRRSLTLRRAPILAALGEREELAAVVAELDDGSLRYPDRLDLLEALVEAEHWPVLLQQARAGKEQATEATVRAEYPDEGFSDEVVAGIARRRRATTQAATGLALAGLGRQEEAEEAFGAAAEYGRTTFLGAADTALARYRGQAQLLAGDAAAALVTLAPEALFSGEQVAAELHAKAYTALNGGMDGYDELVWTERQRLAPAIADFTLPNYLDGEATFSAVRDGGVTLVAFWNPG